MGWDGMNGMGWNGWDEMDGMDGVSNGSFKFLYTFWVYRSCICILMFFSQKLSPTFLWVSKTRAMTGLFELARWSQASLARTLDSLVRTVASLARTVPSLRMDGMDGVSKVSFHFLYTLWVYRSCIYLLIYVIKNCHQHSYEFQNLMWSWGWGNKISKLDLVREFSIFGSKLVIFYAWFWKEL